MNFSPDQLSLPRDKWEKLLTENGILKVPEKLKIERKKVLNRMYARKSASKKLKNINHLKVTVLNLLDRCQKLEVENQKLKKENDEIKNFNIKNDLFSEFSLNILDFNI